MSLEWNTSTLRDLIIWWDNLFPFDYWWRNKHKIPFNSPYHRETNPIDIKFEYEEERWLEYYNKVRKLKKKDREDYAITGKWLRRSFIKEGKLTEEEFDAIYRNLDLSQFDDIK